MSLLWEVVLLLGNHLNQPLSLLLPMESEFIALESTGKEAEWLRNFLSGIPLGVQPTLSVPMIVIAKQQY